MMILCSTTLVPLTKEIRYAYPTILSPFYADDAAFYGSVRRSTVQLRLLMYQRLDRGYLHETDKLIFIDDNPEDEEAETQDFELAGLNFNYVGGSRYLRAYLGPREEL